MTQTEEHQFSVLVRFPGNHFGAYVHRAPGQPSVGDTIDVVNRAGEKVAVEVTALTINGEQLIHASVPDGSYDDHVR